MPIFSQNHSLSHSFAAENELLIAENESLRQKLAVLEAGKTDSRKASFVANAVDQLVTLIDRNYVYECVNQAYCQARGQKRENLVGKTVAAVWGRHRFETVIKPSLDACFSGNVTHAEDWFSFGRTASRYYQVTYHPYKDDVGTVTHVAVVTHDITDQKNAEMAIREENDRLEHRVRERTCALEAANARLQDEVTERKRVEKALRDSEMRYRTVVRDMPAMVCRFLPDGRLTFANSRFCTHFRIAEKDFGTVDVFSLVSPEAQSALEKRLASLTPGNAMITREECLAGCNPDAPVWYQWTDYGIFGEDGAPVEYQAVGIDITEKKNTEEKRRYTRKLELLGTLSGGIAHDFNNLLMGIQGSASLMALKITSPHPIDEDLHTIDHLVRSGADLTRQLLGFSRRRTSSRTPLDINAVVAETARLFKRTRKTIHIREHYAHPLPLVFGDQGQLEQMLLNLFINAWQAMAENGDIGLTTASAVIDADFVRPYAVTHGNYVRISVTDTGNGIDPAVAPHIFDPFFSTKTTSGGTGLGLASVYSIVKSHKGIIDFETHPGKGTTFDVYLPVTEKTPVQTSSEPGPMISGKEVILLVDDESCIVDVGSRMLARLGYTVLTADQGEMAVNVFRDASPPVDLVILNMVMPGMDGRSVFQALRSIRPDIRILLTSGYSIRTVASLMDRKGTGFIQKPYILETLSRAIRRVLDTGHYAPAM
ncbi:PAS domain-containing protein [Desulfosarcina sp. OttesenSCG-928-B08]|nr:PAS domain-containing protein [Desulfosarcina sp. OttesenSCG-928-B08]